ncbi:hypothetical protein [Nitrincola sp. MINF-07-Sa-05]|uniref:hypothetical protein n=1 Tax=Nitrincola salilacus TaxID=3400273 RepID=UPI003917DEC6
MSYSDASTRCLLSALTLSVSLVSPVSALDFSADTTLTRHQNLNKAGYTEDRRNDTSVQLDAGVTWQPAIQTPGLLYFTGDLSARAYDHYTGLNQRELVLGAHYNQRMGLGPDVPWWQVTALYNFRDVNDSQRDSHGWWLGLTLGKALTANLDGRVWLAADGQKGKGDRHSAMSEALQGRKVYDLSGWQFGGELTYWFTDQLSGLVSLSYRDGDIVSSSTQSQPMGYAWLMDPVFGMGTYRAGAKVYDSQLGLMYSVSEQTMLSVGYQHLNARTDLPDSYPYRTYRSSNLHLGFHYVF